MLLCFVVVFLKDNQICDLSKMQPVNIKHMYILLRALLFILEGMLGKAADKQMR